MKKVVIVLILVLSALATFIAVRMATAPTEIGFTQTYALPQFPNLNEIVTDKAPTKQAVAIDGEIIYSNNAEVQPTASTAKTILALMVMEAKPFNQGEQGETITIAPELYEFYKYQLANNGSNTAVQIGEEISEYDALAAALLPSSNNMADSLAVWAFGGLIEYKTFAEAKLKEWGINNTTIGSDASGLSPDTTSTANDLALIAQRLMQNPVLAEIVGLKEHEIPVAGTIKNTNKLLGTDGIIGVKTGYTGDAGYCLLTAYEMNEHTITIASLGAETRDDSFNQSQQTIRELQEKFTETEIAKAGDEVGYYESWWMGKVPIKLTEGGNAIAWSEAEQSTELKMNEASGTLDIKIGTKSYQYMVSADGYQAKPTLLQRFKYAIYQY